MNNFGSILGDVLKNYSGVPQSPNDVQNMPHNDVYNHYQQFAQQASPQQVYDAHQQAFQQLPQDQQQNLFGSLVGALGQHGIDPLQAGAQGSAPTPSNYAQIAQYATQNPQLMQRVFGQNGALNSPLGKMVMAGALAVAADQLSKRMNSNKSTNKGGSGDTYV